MCSTGGDAALPAPGFPIRASAGQRLFSASPRLIAAVHALHRLLVPRHPPCALNILTVIRPGRARSGDTHNSSSAADAVLLRCVTLCSFQGPPRGLGGRRPHTRARSRAGRSLKTQQHELAARRHAKARRSGEPQNPVDMLGSWARSPAGARRRSLERR